jgi:hypothetical protein
MGNPQISAVVISPHYAPNAEGDVKASLSRLERHEVEVNLQQILAADLPSQTKAMIDAAMERTVTGIAADVPPFERVRASIGLPTRGIWTNRGERVINVEPMAVPGWSFADYRNAERRANDVAGGWTVRLLPPVSGQLRVSLPGSEPQQGAIPMDVAIWALQRWGMGDVGVAIPEDEDGAAIDGALKAAGIASRPLDNLHPPKGSAIIEVRGPPPPN